jgi:hypothetical protein
VPAVKTLTRLEAWFDAFIVVCAAGEAPSALAEQALAGLDDAIRPFAVSDLSTPGKSVQVGRPAVMDAAAAQALRLRLREQGVRRPVIWVEDAQAAAFLACWPEAFLALALPQPAADQEALRVAAACDIAVAQNLSALADLTANTDFGGGDNFAWSGGGFAGFADRVIAQVNRMLLGDKKLNVLMLYDDGFTHIKPVWEHLKAFSDHSKYNYFYLPATNDPDLRDVWPAAWDFENFDAVVWHYGLRAALKGYIAPAVARNLAAYSGLKVLFVQDEYDHLENTWASIRDAGIDVVMTVAPTDESARLLYPADKTPGVELIRNLTGYVPEEDIERFARPMEERELRLSYRGRVLAYHYGDLGREKYLIGARMKKLAAERHVPVDIEVDDNHRIYGADWYRFQGSARATLASESGANVADFDGSLKILNDEAVAAGVSYEDFHAAHLAGRDGSVPMNQVSPKIFEAIRLRTALVCFEGNYSGVIQPDVHFIPLKKDFSNADEVFAKLEDLDYLNAMTERAYRDVIESGNWSQRAFINEFDTIVGTRVLKARTEIITAPIALRRRGQSEIQAVPHPASFDFTLNTAVLQNPMRRDVFKAMMARNRDYERAQADFKVRQSERPPQDAILVEKLFPTDMRAAFDGAVRIQVEGAVITTSPDAWTYAGFINLDLSAIDFEHELCWAHIRVKDVFGWMLFGSYNPDIDKSLTEWPMPNGAQEQDVFIPVFANQTALLFRNGEEDGVSRATFLSGEILTASAYERAMLRVAHQLMVNNIPLSQGEDSSAIRYGLRRPAAPPADARVKARIDGLVPGAVVSMGGEVTPVEAGTEIRTPAAPWSFGAAVDFDLSGMRLEHEFCWLRITLASTHGDLRLALWDRAASSLVFERPCTPAQAEQQILIPVVDPAYSSLLLRTGLIAGGGGCVFLRAEVVTASRYPAGLLTLFHAMAKALAETADPPATVEAQAEALVDAPVLDQPAQEAPEPLAGPAEQKPVSVWRRLADKLR